MPRRRLGRLLLVWAIDAVAFWLLAAVLPGVDIDSPGAAIATAAVVGLLNALLWPIVIAVALPLAFYTAGLGALVLNGVVLLAASDVLAGFDVHGLGSAIFATLVLTALTTMLSALLAVDDDDSFQRRVVLRRMRRVPDPARTDVPGVIFLEIDGLSIDTLRRALRDGHVPMLARWIQEGTPRIVPWECDLSSQTGASQAGLLHGNNSDMPAFRWYEKETGRTMVSNHPKDAAELERRVSDGEGLLARDGASRGNPRPYEFVILSDHGQSQGATFLQRYGRTLEDVVQEAIAEGRNVTALKTSDEGWAQVGSALSDAAGGSGARAKIAARATRLTETRQDETLPSETPDAIVMPSGCLALIYLLDSGERMTREEIDAHHPQLISTLAAHPGIGFVLVRSAADGALAIGARGVRRLRDDEVDGEDPLAPFPPTAFHHLRRTDGFPHAPDLLVNALYDPATDEVPAFEELVGSHGGLGGAQSRPFALVPAGWEQPGEPLIGAEAMHRQMQQWVRAVQSAAAPVP
jgi:uncharacterized membrane protein YvlD (DUF360 family)